MVFSAEVDTIVIQNMSLDDGFSENEMSGVKGVRADVVARFKREIENKTYKVKSQEIADKITQKLREDEKVAASIKGPRWTA